MAEAGAGGGKEMFTLVLSGDWPGDLPLLPFWPLSPSQQAVMLLGSSSEKGPTLVERCGRLDDEGWEIGTSWYPGGRAGCWGRAPETVWIPAA